MIFPTIVVGDGNVYTNFGGTLMSAPINADGSISLRQIDWCEVTNWEEKPEELKGACRKLGIKFLGGIR